MMNHVHQVGLFDPRNARRLIIFGGGSVGGYVALFAAKAGIRDIELWDADTVESYNVPMSVFGPQHVGMYKVDAVAEVVRYLTGTELKVRRRMYAGEPISNAAVVSCVDKMNTGRRPIWSAVRMNPTVDLHLDTRTAGAFVEVYCNEPCRKEDIEIYEKTLCDDSEVAIQTCGNHGVIYASVSAAQAVIANVTHYWEHGTKLWRFAERSDTLDRVGI